MKIQAHKMGETICNHKSGKGLPKIAKECLQLSNRETNSSVKKLLKEINIQLFKDMQMNSKHTKTLNLNNH